MLLTTTIHIRLKALNNIIIFLSFQDIFNQNPGMTMSHKKTYSSHLSQSVTVLRSINHLQIRMISITLTYLNLLKNKSKKLLFPAPFSQRKKIIHVILDGHLRS